MKWLFTFLLLFPFGVDASTFFPEEQTVLNEASPESVFVMDERIRIEKPIEGDLFCVGVTVEIHAPVRGDIICAARTITITAPVRGDLRLFSLTTSINAAIAQRASIVSSALYLGKKAQVTHEWYAWGSTLEHQLLPDQAQRIRWKPLFGIASRLTREERIAFFTVRYALSVASALAIAFFMGVLFPQRIQNAYRFMEKRKRYALLWGAWLAIGMPVVALLCIFTIIGIPVGFAILAIWFATAYSAQVLAAGLLGLIIVRHWHPRESLMKFAAPAVGIPLAWALFYLPVVGWFFRILAISMGLAGMYFSAKEKIGKNVEVVKKYL